MFDKRDAVAQEVPCSCSGQTLMTHTTECVGHLLDWVDWARRVPQFSRQVLIWSMYAHMKADLVIESARGVVPAPPGRLV